MESRSWPIRIGKRHSRQPDRVLGWESLATPFGVYMWMMPSSPSAGTTPATGNPWERPGRCVTDRGISPRGILIVHIGTDITGTWPMGRRCPGRGLGVGDAPSDVTIGGTVAGSGNIVRPTATGSSDLLPPGSRASWSRETRSARTSLEPMPWATRIVVTPDRLGRRGQHDRRHRRRRPATSFPAVTATASISPGKELRATWFAGNDVGVSATGAYSTSERLSRACCC